MATRSNIEAGPAGAAVRTNVAALRRYRNLDQPTLAERTAKLGRPLSVSTISRIEQGDRRVDVDDLMVLAAALNVDPATLLLPSTLAGEIEITPAVQVPARQAWEWVRGLRPPPLPGDQTAESSYWSALDYARFSSPPGLIPAEQIITTNRDAQQ